ncbi:MAG: type II secretion system F family protein [Nitrospirota bacterium]|nr:MAG: type II secretion system F family protein [Nitrospirota bacterium]
MNTMPMFHYMGKNQGGQSVQGDILARSSREAIHLLRRQDLLVTHLTEKVVSVLGASQWKDSWRKPRVTNKELVVFTQQFATLIRAGVPILECLDILGTETENSAWQPVVSRICADIEQGALLAKALGRFPTIFHEFYRNMVEVGETNGQLDESLTQLAVYLEKQAQLRAKVVSALAYPALLVTVALTVLVFLLVWVVPLFSGLFQVYGESLPWLTQVVIHLADSLREHIVLFVGFLGSLVVGSRLLLSNTKSRQVIDGVILRLPLFGPIFRKSAIVRFARTLGFLVRRGVPLLTGLSVAATVTGNTIMEHSIKRLVTEVQDGNPLSETLRTSGVFPLMVTQMIKVGESTGSLDSMLEKIADLFEQEVDRSVATLTSLLEPCVIVVVGSGIALVVVAMYLPIFSIGSVIG